MNKRRMGTEGVVVVSSNSCLLTTQIPDCEPSSMGDPCKVENLWFTSEMDIEVLDVHNIRTAITVAVAPVPSVLLTLRQKHIDLEATLEMHWESHSHTCRSASRVTGIFASNSWAGGWLAI